MSQTTNPPPLLLKSNLKQLRLPTMLSEFEKLAREASVANEHYEQYLLRLTELEVATRQSNALQARIKQANFPVHKDFDTYDFSAMPALPKQKVLELSRGEWIDQRHNCCLLGQPGTGKPRPTQYPVCHRGMRGGCHGHGPNTPSIREELQACWHC